MLILTLLAATVLPLGNFEAVDARNGAHVVIRHGAVHRVSVVQGDPRCIEVTVSADKRLRIDNVRHCESDERTRIEVVTPYLSAVSMSNGGSLETRGAFPAQPDIEADVEQGGTIDIRSIPADRVVATVYSGGRIFTTAEKTLEASVESGGIITYWGDVENVKRSVRHGGVVVRGAADEAEKPVLKN